ncbi:MAG TPA: response regulator transcription factor [Rhodospirillaceae bacterium]|nr:response regulator transcription factor [Rhodospirillaceae bacterium]
MRPGKRNYIGTVVVAVANPVIRRALIDSFRQSGADEVLDPTDWKALAEILAAKAVVLMVVDDTLSQRPTADLIRKIRQGELHAHPFPLIIMLANEREEHQLRALIDCGPDAIVLTPISIADLFSKIDMLASGRKPFVITRDYVGPDRRKAPREGAGEPKIISPPNPLARGVDGATFQKALKESQSSLKTAKMECSLGQLAWAMRSGKASDFLDLIPVVDRLVEAATSPGVKSAAEGLAAALRGGSVPDIMDCCRKLLAQAGDGK